MTEQTIAAVYDTPAHAELAVQDLLQAGIPETAIHRHAQEGSYAGRASEPLARTQSGTEERGFWASLFGGEPDHDTAVYDRSVATGGTAVTVRVAEEHAATVTRVLEMHAPIDIDERASSFGLDPAVVSRAQHNTVQPGMMQQGAAQTGSMQAGSTQAGAVQAGAVKAGAVKAGAMRTDGQARDGETMQLAEERLDIGKRVVNRGTTRVRRFVVETPVEEQVNLRDEKVSVERRPVSGGAVVNNPDFSEKTIELTEMSEEAVVSKVARVKEEIALRKEAADRTETVRETLRHEDVEIEKVPGIDVTPGARSRSKV